MYRIALWLCQRGYRLRSGGARGADRAFERGALDAHTEPVIFKQDDWTPLAMSHAKLFHPAWKKCSSIAKKLHARNSLIMLDEELDSPVSFVVCWTVDGQATGGTGQALRIAADERYNIPVFNLFYPDAEDRLYQFVKDLEHAKDGT